MAQKQSKTVKSNIDLNTASVDELAKLPMVGRQRAQEIVNYRNEHGPFRSLDDLKNIPSFSKTMIDDLKQSGVTIK